MQRLTANRERQPPSRQRLTVKLRMTNREPLAIRNGPGLADAGESIQTRSGKSGFALELHPFADPGQHELEGCGARDKPGQEEARIEIMQTVGSRGDPAF